MKRCAIYTRKSSDEGLDQQFNSLDAQREACEAYVLSQAGEGWTLLPERYDDGGYSGGSMERPGLKQLLDDVGRGQIDVVVVYKIDRLTRSLADFARIVERFDATEASFVSVTQAFNTTSSMGRLTLNVLLSFAQFEREVTGERIRDKIAASKARGMWMGGLPPLGYDAPPSSDRILQVNEEEAATVRSIFGRYLELGSVHLLLADLTARGIVSKRRVRRDGSASGGQHFSRGALFHLLRNCVYRGEIVHKGEVFPGLHEAIVPPDLFERVQAMLDQHRTERRKRTTVRAPLTGKLLLGDGTKLTPTHSRGGNGRTYHYYAPVAATRDGADASRLRLPARRFEARLRTLLGRLAGSDDPLALVRQVIVHREAIEIRLDQQHERALRRFVSQSEQIALVDDQTISWAIPFAWPTRDLAIEATTAPSRRDPVLVRALRTAHAMLEHDRRGRPLLRHVPAPRYERRLARLAFLSPTLQAAILAGTQPTALTLEKIVRGNLPLDWSQQERWASRLG